MSAVDINNTRCRIAILDDWQDAARTCADWTPLEARASMEFFGAPLASEDEAAERLAPFDVNVPMFVPPAHGIVFLTGLSLAFAFARHARVVVAAAAVAAVSWGGLGLVAIPPPQLCGPPGLPVPLPLLLPLPHSRPIRVNLTSAARCRCMRWSVSTLAMRRCRQVQMHMSQMNMSLQVSRTSADHHRRMLWLNQLCM